MKKLAVIGNGMVGHHFVEQLVKAGGEFEISVFAEEASPAYDRVHLSEYFSHGDAERLLMTTDDTYQSWGVNLHLNAQVQSLDLKAQRLKTSAGQFDYDYCVLATGSYPFVPPIPGNDRDHCLVYRTLDDLEAIKSSAQGAKVGVVVGGGLLGLEAANALKNLGLEAHVVEFAPQLMPVQLDPEGGELLKRRIQALDVHVHTDTATQAIVEGSERRLAMQFASGESLETDLIVFSAGIRPQDALAGAAGLALGSRGGIAVDDRCKSSDSRVYAIGECAVWSDRQFGLVAPGYAMARAAVSDLTGGSARFTGADMSTKLKLLGVEVGSIGDAHAASPGAKVVALHDQAGSRYLKLVVNSKGTQLLGACLVGDTSGYDDLLQRYLNGMKLPENPMSLLVGGGGESLDAGELPDTASICSCHNVTKGQIQTAVAAGCMSVGDVKAETDAATGCGGCAALLKTVVDDALVALGVEVNDDICEHFAMNRQALFDTVKVNGYRTFDEVRSAHGKGLGCDICKPAVGNILASLWNEDIQKPEHIGLQDTNDRYMANMQKDGTFSVVPRIPGGEITPEKLIVLGQVAQKYKLYTKITGGQRIDLFGATLNSLPLIWEELIEAGFETGQAYGKSVRTVKSCVGSTWCRYGVQDSVGMAIFLEDRYKGLRSPHKLKFAVSGCTRECAEAQSKDIGVIATERGWNLYVCGNGGMRPRHAELFATDLNDEELIRYIDRVLMFYVKTADRLQRTSVWRENLEGGLDYLKDVVINDSLGLAAELEAQMQRVVGTFECEWKATVNDPEKRKHFRQYVNSDREKVDVVRIVERDQLRPV